MAGPNLDGEKYMASIGGVVTGSDTVSYEQMIVLPHPVHRWMRLLTNLGNPVSDLEELAKDWVYEGVYIALPLTIVGTTGSMINPIFVH